MSRYFYVCLLSLSLFIAGIATPAIAALKEVQFQEVEEDINNLSKKYPYLKPVIDSTMSNVDEDSATAFLMARTDLNSEKSFVFLQVQNSFYCGSAFGCGTAIFLDEGHKNNATQVFGIQLPGKIYVGLCGDNPVMVAQLWKPGTEVEHFRAFPQGPDGMLHFGQFFPTLDKVDLCAPIDAKAEADANGN